MHSISPFGRALAAVFALGFALLTGQGAAFWTVQPWPRDLSDLALRLIWIQVLGTLSIFFALTFLYYTIGPRPWMVPVVEKYARRTAIIALLVNLALMVVVIAF